jgi:transposase
VRATEHDRADVAATRAAWRDLAPTLARSQLVLLGENGVRTDSLRRYRRGRRGVRIHDAAPDGRWHTTTFLAGLRAHLWFLLKYRPDFNPIELCSAKLKATFRAARCRTIETLWQTIGLCRPRFDAAGYRNYFRHCGYTAATVR